jgi:hypothetical protein
MAYLELKGSLMTKGNKIKGLAPTLYDMRNARRLVDNPNEVLSQYHLYLLICGFATQTKNLSTATRALQSS